MQLVRGVFWPTQIGYLLRKKGHYSNASFFPINTLSVLAKTYPLQVLNMKDEVWIPNKLQVLFK